MSTSGLGLSVAVLTTVFIVLAVLSCVLRIVACRIRSRNFRLHDYLILAALVFALVQYFTVWSLVLNGKLGKHTVNITAIQLSSLFKSFTANNIAWIFATNVSKLSVLFFYLDIFSIRVFFRRLSYGFVGFVIVYGISSLLCVFTICRPFAATWDHDIPNAKCGNIMSAMFATAVINMVEDLVVVLMPMPILWKLQIPSQKKAGMSAIIGAGFIICAINIARLGCAAVTNQSDPAHTLAYQVLFMNLEVQLGIINACLPTIKPLFKCSTHSSKQQLDKPAYSTPEDTRKILASEKELRNSLETRSLAPDDEKYYEGNF